MAEWSCDCGPHTEQIWDYGWPSLDPDVEPVEVPLLCFVHKRHEPCRRCLREEAMTPEETFAEIARLLNLILEAEGNYDLGVDVHQFQNTKYLLGKRNDEGTAMDVVAYIKYNEEDDVYEVVEGDPDD